ncbi:hypothetical protein BSKO_12791 [Bryopsis sp. KO-2023]|nr:hypothetical protein BSKO_12791 [Bryopsis sp. KO-2023]
MTDYSKTRRPLRDLQDEYDDKSNMQGLEDLMYAWYKVKELPPADERSFFTLGGYHGQPFVARKDVDGLPDEERYTYWGGYCQHGNVLFPTWHRVYVLKVEQALQSFKPGVMLPYWDETSDETFKKGVPKCLTDELFDIPEIGLVSNPLRSFTLPVAISDSLGGEGQYQYDKPKGYTTVRYPLSGLVHDPQQRMKTKKHNAKYKSVKLQTSLLNENVTSWLRDGPPHSEYGADLPVFKPNGLRTRYLRCLDAPNYTVFSNTTSAYAFPMADLQGKPTMPLEQPHNDMHLAVGGYDPPPYHSNHVPGANGDMGENNTAGLDPIFFFHHCFVDRVFWEWQVIHKAKEHLDIKSGYPGTLNVANGQGPTPGQKVADKLSLDTELAPFRHRNKKMYTSKECISMPDEHGTNYQYRYAPGSLPGLYRIYSEQYSEAKRKASKQVLVVSGIDRSQFEGSFIITAYAVLQEPGVREKRIFVGNHSVLSRFNVRRCANCMAREEVRAIFSLEPLACEGEVILENATFDIEVTTAGGVVVHDLECTTEVEMLNGLTGILTF